MGERYEQRTRQSRAKKRKKNNGRATEGCYLGDAVAAGLWLPSNAEDGREEVKDGRDGTDCECACCCSADWKTRGLAMRTGVCALLGTGAVSCLSCLSLSLPRPPPAKRGLQCYLDIRDTGYKGTSV